MSMIQIFDQTTPLVSGYSMRSRYITESLKNLGVSLDVFSSPIFEYKNTQEKINGVPYTRSAIKGWPFIRKIPFLKEKLIINTLKNTISENWSNRVRVIDAHSSLLNGIVAAKLKDKFRVPFIYEVRALWEDAAVDQGKTKEGSFRYNLTRSMETDVINKADKVTVICEGLRKELISRGVSEEKIAVIPNGVDIDKFQPLYGKDKMLCDQYFIKNDFVFGFIGTFFEFEGLKYLVQAAAKILKERNDVKFMIVGSGRDEPALKQMVEKLNVKDKIVFTGRVNHDEILRYYSVIDCLVYPRVSKRITELVTPLKPLEAMALQKPLIASNVGGLKELIEDGKTGVLFKTGDIDDLVRVYHYVLDHPQRMKDIAQEGRRYVEQERNWQTICKKYIDIFEELGVNPCES